MFICFLLSILNFVYIFSVEQFIYINLGTWISCDMFLVNWAFQLDYLSTIMFCVVTSVSFLVHLFSCSYMSKDPHVPRFMSYLSFFTFFMLILVSSDNFIILFLGWEGVGLCSYLLISFWFTRISSNKAALKAMIVNRVGDCSFSLGIFCIYYVFRSFDFHTVFTLVPYFINTQILRNEFLFLRAKFLVDSPRSIIEVIGPGPVYRSLSDAS